MQARHISASALIEAPADLIYGIIADYKNGHPHILPKKFFPGLEVEEGGVGAGTRIRAQMRAFGSTRTFRAEITEPQPGRVLVETELENGTVTTFTVDPQPRGGRTKVTITTELKPRGGVLGRIEGMMATGFLERVYAQELGQLASVAVERARLEEVEA